MCFLGSDLVFKKLVNVCPNSRKISLFMYPSFDARTTAFCGDPTSHSLWTRIPLNIIISYPIPGCILVSMHGHEHHFLSWESHVWPSPVAILFLPVLTLAHGSAVSSYQVDVHDHRLYPSVHPSF